MKHPYKFIWFFHLLFFFVSVRAVAQLENCYNGIDDDGDGLVDCQDGDCAPLPFCRVEGDDGSGNLINCGDGIDNDNDGLTDCQEPACAANTTICPVETDCGNGIDDDGDGFFDYYDGDCLNDPSNPNDYIVTKPDCEAMPVGNVFEIEPAWDSDIRTSAAMGMPSVADLDLDGIPEVITLNSSTGRMFILDGRDGSEINSVNVGGGFGYPAVADVDGDSLGEIFTIDTQGWIRVYENDLTPKWTERSVFRNHGRQLGLADFNSDGRAELYYGNEIRDAETGQLLIRGSHGSTTYPSANNWQTELNAVPVAVDILPDPGLELVHGHIIYTVNITNTGGTAGNAMAEALDMDDAANLPADYLGYHPADADWGGQTYSNTAVVDYNQDGNLDVIMGGANGHHDGPTSAFFWDLANDEVRMFFVTRPGNTIPGCPDNSICENFRDMNDNACNAGEDCYWRRGMGNINVADIDNDGEVEATFMSGSSLFALETDFTLKWANHDDFWESSSGFTGTTVFDFDGDGSSEIVYRDEVNLYIVDGFTGQPLNLLNGTFCSSQTQADFPIVADVDGDGETEIIVSCGELENNFGQGTATGSTRDRGFIRAYKAAGSNYWVPSRALWNQTNYFNVNINDNLTVPRIQQPHHLSFSQICNDPNVVPPFALNKFLNQSPRISFCGQLAFPAPRLDFADDGVVVDPPVCPDNQFRVRLIFENNGDQAVNSAIPLSFYADDPTATYGNTDESPYLETINLLIAGGLQVGQRIDTTITVNAIRGAFELFVSLNDRGQYDSLGAPMTNEDFYPLISLNGTVRECDNQPTIVSRQVNPLPFEVHAVVARDNMNCPGASANNGEIQVFAADSTVLPGASYSFRWTDIHTGQVIGTNALVTGLDSGTYRIEVVNTDYGCTGNADTVTVRRFEEWPDTKVVTVDEIQPVSSCTPGTADGIARVLINGAAVDETNYDIVWEDEQQPGILAVGDTATNLQPILYRVTVTNNLTGCSETQTLDMTLDVPDMGQPTVTQNNNCRPPFTGSVNARMNSGNRSDYDFVLIQMSPVQDTLTNHTNGSFTGLDEGIYELRAFDPATMCGYYSEGLEVEITTTRVVDNIPIQVAQEQSSCSPPYNGQLTAVLSNPNRYEWVWYRGTVTTGSTAEVVATDYITPDTLSTNLTDIYTVIATDASSGCSFTGQIQLTENIILPSADANGFTVNHQTTCNPNGSIQAVVSNPEAGATYTYRLLQGSTELSSNNTGLFENLEAGPYVVVIENDLTTCVSAPSAIIEVEDQITPFGAISINETPLTNCNPSSPNGQLSVIMADGNANYDFRWFAGVDTANAISPQPSPSGVLGGITEGDYMLRIRNLNTGCDTLMAISLSDMSANYQDSISATVTQHQTYCTSDRNGAIQANLIQSVAGGIPDPNNYTFYWYAGRKTQVRSGTAASITGENSATLDGLDAGWYSVRAVRNDGFGCHALDTAEIEILDHRDYPVSNIQVDIVEQSSCNSNNPNGGLLGNVGGNTSDYIFSWYELVGGVYVDITDNNPNALVNGASVTGIGTGNYVLEVEHIETGCTGATQVYLGDNIIRGSEIRLNLGSTATTRCDNPDGSAQVTSIELSEDGGNTFTSSDDIINYSFQWYEGTDTSTPIAIADNATANTAHLEGVQPGMYTVVATNNASSCASVSYTVEVESELQNNLTFDFNTVSVQEDCIDPDGGVEVVNISGGSGNYSYQWYVGTTDSYPITGANTTTLENIRSNSYMFRITDENTGCHADGVYMLPTSDNLTPVPPASLNSFSHSTSCSSPNGELVAEVDAAVRLASYPAHAADDFLYYWFEGENVEYVDPNGDLDDPLNYQTFGPAPNPGVDNRATLSNLAPGLYTVVVVDAQDYIASIGTPSFGTIPFGCQSEPRTFEVLPIAQSPAVTFTTQPDSLCAGNSGQATITAAKRVNDTTTFSEYEVTNVWLNGSPLGLGTLTITDTHASNSSTFTISDLAAGEYRFQITDRQTSCDTTINLDINEEIIFPAWAPTDVTVEQQQTVCAPVPNGRLSISNSPGGVGVLSDYTFFWRDNIASSDPALGALASGLTIDNLSAGTYYVYARNNATGCFSSHLTLEIEDHTPETIVEIVSSQADRNCDPAAGDGIIRVEIYDIDHNNNETYPVGGYTISWFDEFGNNITAQASPNTGDTGGGTSRASSTLSALQAGAYSITIQNNETQCATVTARDTIDFEPYIPRFTANSAQITPSTTCNGNGEVRISEISENGIIINSTDAAFADYGFNWFGADGITPLTNGMGVSITGTQAEHLLPGTYTVSIHNNNTGCTSDVLTFVIEDQSTNPLIYQQEIIDFISCSGSNEGAIEVYGGERDPAINHTYRYEWTLADGTAMPTYAVYNTDSSRVENLVAGEYRVSVTNEVTGCSSEQTFTIGSRQVLPILLMAKLADQSNCLGDGAAEVDAVNFMGSPLNLDVFSFYWFQNAPDSDPLASPDLGLNADSLSADQLVAGNYYVIAENRITGCRTLPVQVNIEDNSEPLIVLLDDISGPITACDPANFADGDIEIEVRNSQHVVTSWYEGSEITNFADSIPSFNNSLEIDNLVPGTYTVWVMDTLSGCSTTRTYNIEGIEVPLVVTTSSNSYSSCIQPDGMVAAQVSGGSGNFIYSWYITDESGVRQLDVPDNMSYVEGLVSGTYTVAIQDRIEPYCEEAQSQVVVKDGRGDEIMITVHNDFSMTNCDQNSPNGQLSVDVNGELSRYNFFWYAGTSSQGQPISSGPVASNLPAGDYTVIARDRVTGCISNTFTGSVVALPDTTFIPVPQVSTRPVSRCDAPNGSATASLDSNLINPQVDYIFTWFNEEGQEIFSSARHPEINFLTTGNYSVMATNSLTGCSSGVTEFRIGEEIYTPEFELLSTPSTCLEENGTIMIDFIEPMRVVDIEWITPNGYASGFFLSNQPPGYYKVNVTDDKGCVHTQSGVILSNLHTYNGVSPNGDGKNDRFIISCIEQYDENQVKIYNRAGALVYENQSYDNETVYFEGIGNRGLYIGGEKLPEGTYYYIIDKNNGDEPESGFLELLR